MDLHINQRHISQTSVSIWKGPSALWSVTMYVGNTGL